ncbi:MAG: RNA chaperone Hfq [Mesoaciditoga sp.]|uniref:RNA chaperone Hfq n=1 Tax=Athalassotoga sp. TaxID=2022597 RepID=UPI000CAB367D|nr:MAG: RNA chaperone Hfq [Mesoaciditoga sp.]PMP79133.1 MAG: RNA chaperone Hfq [Mesoaciditoga sp.]HEU24589.1 RNA chaperone Hfq [Mesoaciditoga lauensis]
MAKESLQDSFLSFLQKNRTEVKIYLTNGVQIKGFVKDFDPFVVLVESEDQKQSSMIYKAAISTIVPAEKFTPERNKE